MNAEQHIYRTMRHQTKVYLNTAACLIRLIWIRLVMFATGNRNPLIGIFLIEHLGDIVACEPVARFLRREHPDAYLVWCVRPPYADLVRNHPALTACIQVHCLSVKKYLVRSGLFTSVIDLHFPERFCALCRTKAPAGVQTEITLGNFYQFGNILQSFSRYAGLPELNEPPQLWLLSAPEILPHYSLTSHRYIVFHCSSNTPDKEWESNHWNTLARFITDNFQITVVEIGSVSLIHSLTDKYCNACGTTSLAESAELIRSAALFIGIDSGPAHIANALSTPGIILMGSYLNFKRYNPFSSGYGNGTTAQIIFTDGPVSTIQYSDVREKVSKTLNRLMRP
jgi:heptosyltransferase III